VRRSTSVRFGPDGSLVVTDGPSLEGKESIGGYAEIDVAPGRATVEIRPVVTRP
jgi:hypothetical protein